MEDVAGDYHEVWLKLHGFVDDFFESPVEVFASRFEVVLRVAQVDVSYMDEA
jgi:hypothetical protein